MVCRTQGCHRFLAAAALLIAAAACSDSTAPESNVTVYVTLTSITEPLVLDEGGGAQRIECEIVLRAEASGDGRATWRHATLLFYAGADRSTPLDSSGISETEVQSSWDATDIAPGDTLVSGWRVSAAVPFAAALVYYYQPPHAAVQSSRVEFTCGPYIQSPPSPPTINAVTVQPDSNAIEPGARLTVHFIAQSAVGLWSSTVRVSGACALEQHFVERFLQSSEHTATFTIPAACTLGQLLWIDVLTTDAALQTTAVHTPRSLAVVDRTRPYLYADHLPTASSYFFSGDTLQPFLAATDNAGVRWVIWEIQPGGIRDSISGAGGWFVSIPIRPEWAGTSIQLRFWARDRVGLESDTVVAPVAGLPIYPTVQPPMRSTTVNGDIQDVAFDQKRGALYLRNYASIGVFSLASMAITETILLQTVAEDLDLTAGGDSLILALPYQKALGVIDLQKSPRTVTLLPIRSLTTGQAPWQLTVGANGRVYVILEGATPTPTALLELDLATGSERLVPGSDALVGAGFERSFDRTALIFKRGTDLLQRYDLMSDQFGPLRTPRSIYGPLRVDETGSTVAVGLDVYDRNLDFVRRVAAVYGAEAMPGSALSRDGAYLYHVLGYRGVARTRTSDGAVVDRFKVPFSASGYLRISPDGSTLIVMDSFMGTARVALVDLR